LSLIQCGIINGTFQNSSKFLVEKILEIFLAIEEGHKFEIKELEEYREGSKVMSKIMQE
jgi:hypothetical protein